MKITGLKTHAVHVNHRGDWTFLAVHTDEGITGYGEVNPGGARSGSVDFLQQAEPVLAGRDPGTIERILAELLPSPVDRSKVMALSALDQALWDIKGKLLGVPVADLIGGRCRDEIPLYANINRATTDRTPAGFARNAAAAVADGFDAVKLAPFDGMPAGIDRASDAREGIACMEAVRAAIGPDISLLIDCHSHFTARGGCEVFDALRDLNLYWYEEPVPDEDHEGYLAIKDHIDVPLAGGESLMYREGFWPVLDQGLMDVIMPDVTIVGGLWELKKVAAMAEGRGIPTAPHGPFGPLAIAAGVQAMAAHPGFQILEYAWGEVPWRHELLEPQERIEGGRIRVSDRPGLGVSLNMDAIETYRADRDL